MNRRAKPKKGELNIYEKQKRTVKTTEKKMLFSF